MEFQLCRLKVIHFFQLRFANPTREGKVVFCTEHVREANSERIEENLSCTFVRRYTFDMMYRFVWQNKIEDGSVNTGEGHGVVKLFSLMGRVHLVVSSPAVRPFSTESRGCFFNVQ